MKMQKWYLMLHRGLAMILAFALLFGMLPAAVQASPAGSDGAPVLSEPEHEAEQRLLDMLDQDNGLQKAELTEPVYASDEVVTVIVNLEEVSSTTQGGIREKEAQHQRVQNEIASLIEAEASDLAHATADGPAPSTFAVRYDYYEVINGFAADVEYRFLKDIAALDAVESVYVETIFTVPEDQEQDYKNANSLAMVGADNSPYTGDGQVIAIIDSGVDVEHEAFQGQVPTDALTEGKLSELTGRLHAGNGALAAAQLRVDDKFPFAYDYADRDTNAIPGPETGLDHGTHVAGIAAANSGDTIRGVAPDAQIVAMKVFDDLLGQGRESNIIAAVEDAVTLGVDVINMSLGSDAGFSTSTDEQIQRIYDSVKSHGVILNVAAGNAYSSTLGNEAGNNLPAVTNPDSSIVASPATQNSALAVASVNTVSQAYYLVASDGTRIAYKEATVEGKTLLASLNGTLEYVDCGYGSAADFDHALTKAGLTTLEGRIALVQRGVAEGEASQLTFEQKVDNAYAKSAKAIIVYDNVASESLTDMGGITKADIGSVFISKADGEKLLSLAGKTVTVGPDQWENGALTMSDFSSWGVTLDLELKPEIAAPGGNIYSAVLNNAYATMSGTSMASPHMAGLSALTKQYIESDAKFAAFHEDEKINLVSALLMATAEPLTRGENSYYSPRQQGAGLANIQAVANAKAYLTVEGADPAKPKAELGDGTGPYRFTFTVHNLTGDPLTYVMNAAALSEEIADGFFQQKSKNYAGDGITVTYTGAADDGTISVPSHGAATVTVTITPEESFRAAVAEAVNGTFIDGFVFLMAGENSGSDLSLPYLAFYGDWSAAPVLDGLFIDGDSAHYMRSSYVYSASNSYYYLGQNVFNGAYGIDPDKYVISADSMAQIFAELGTVTGMLRNADQVTYTVTQKDTGRVMQQDVFRQVKKSYYFVNAGVVTYAEAFLPYAPTFSGLDSSGREIAEGWYTFTIAATRPGSQELDTWTFDFYYDTTPPKLEHAEIVGETGQQTLVLHLSDNHYLSAVQLVTSEGKALKTFTFDDPDNLETRQADGRSLYTVEADLEELIAALEQAGDRTDRIRIDAFDYAVNYAELSTVVRDTYPTGITLNASQLQMTRGKVMTLTATLEPETVTKDGITWSSSDPAVAAVDEAGAVRAISAGTAVVTAQTEAEGVAASCTVTVEEIPAQQGIVMDYDEITLNMGTSSQLTASLATGVGDAMVTWTSGDAQVAMVDENGVVFGVSTGRTTVTASVTADGVTYSASCAVSVRPEDYDDFVIDDDGVLKEYTGWRTQIAIPEGVTKIDDYVFAMRPVKQISIPASVTEIGNYAFSNCQRLYQVTFAEGSKLYEIGDYAFETTVITEIELPSSLRKIGRNAFYSCYFLNTVHLPEGLTELSAYIFYACGNLKNINLPSTLKTIGDYAFASCGVEVLEFPAGLETIGDYAFSGAPIRTFTAPAGLVTIGRGTFVASGITQAHLNDGLKTIGAAAFSQTYLTSLTLPDSVTEVGDFVLQSCPVLKEVTIGAGVTSLYAPFVSTPNLEHLFVADGNTSFRVVDNILFSMDGTVLVSHPAAQTELVATGAYTIPANVTAVADYAFAYLANLEQLRFAPETQLAEIGAFAFSGTPISSLAVPDSVKTIGGNAFSFCKSLTELDLNQVETVGDYAFQYDVFVQPDLGDALVELGAYSFAWCPNLEIVVFPDSLTTVGKSAFSNCPKIRSITIGASLTDLGEISFTGANNLETIHVSEKNAVFSSVDGVLLRDSGKEIVLCPPKNPMKEFIAPATVEIVANFAFRNVTTLEKVTFQEGLKTLGTSAFNGCTSLKEIQLPNSLETVGAFAFANAAIETLTLGDNLQTVASWAFSFMGSLKHLVFTKGNDTSVAWIPSMDALETLYLGDGVKTLERSAFSGNTTLKHVVLGAGITDVGEYLFNDVFKTVFYAQPGTPGYASGEALVADLNSRKGAQVSLQAYTPLSVELDAAQDQEAAQVTASATGGIEGTEYRFVTVDPNGVETELQGFSTQNTATVPMGDTDLTVRVYVRDMTQYTISKDLTISAGSQEAEHYTMSAVLSKFSFMDLDNSEISPIIKDTVEIEETADDTYLVTVTIESGNLPSFSNYNDGNFTGQNITALRYRRSSSDYDMYEATMVYDNPVTGVRQYRMEMMELPRGLQLEFITNLMAQHPIGYLKVAESTRTPFVTDRSDLNATIAVAEALAEHDYTAETWANLADALEEARAVAANETATQSQVNDAATGLAAAIQALVEGHKHTNTKLVGQKEATCTEAGYTGDEVCIDCGEIVKQGEVIPATGHRFDKTVVAPTCTTSGYDAYVCSVCGYGYHDHFTAPLGHGETELQNAKEATCTEDGYTGDKVCTVCGEIVEQGEVIPATGHSWDEGVVKVEPGCCEEGVMHHTCTVCGETKEENISAKGHQYEKTVIAPTCTTSGYDEYTCSVCGYRYHDNFTAPLGHGKTELRNAKEATCTEDGYTGDEVCTVCGETVKQGEAIPALGHKTELRNAKEATCTEDGYTGDEVCTVCGETVKQGEVIPALGHKTELRNAKEATCTEDGYTGDEVCTVCGEIVKRGEVIPAHCASQGFMDLDITQWYHGYTDYVLDHGFMNGISATRFAPNGALTRGQLVTTLYRLAGTPEVTEPATFTDVKEGRYYTDAVAWAEDLGIVQGMTTTTFVPEGIVTREQAATFLYRYVTLYLKQEPIPGADLKAYIDGEAVHSYAKTAMSWAVAEGFFEGYGDGTLRPGKTLTRAQMAKLLTILDQNF